MSKSKKAEKAPVSGTELLEAKSNLNQQLSSTESFLQKNRLILGIVAGLVVVVAVGYFIYIYLRNSQDQSAQEEMFAAVYYLQSDSTNRALKGDGNYPGFKDIIEDYPLSKGANLARFYSGVAYMKQGKFNEAITELKSFSSSDLMVQGRAYCLIGDAYMELNKVEDAAGYYRQAADYKPNKFFTPVYLMKLALAYEKLKKNEEAIAAYDKIINLYFNSNEVLNAKKYKARLEAMLGK
jgi:tetratricopeptide (TPR) repeat protein